MGQQTCASAPPDGADWHPLLMVAMVQLIDEAAPRSVLWVVGDTWVRCENCQYSIGADEPATLAQVRKLLIEADWNAQEWVCG